MRLPHHSPLTTHVHLLARIGAKLRRLSHYSPLTTVLLLIAALSCNSSREKAPLTFKDYPALKIGFSTQNFQKAAPVNVQTLTEYIEYAAREGYQFIELRDDLARLNDVDCQALAEVARKNKIEIIYELHKNPLDSGFLDVFRKGLSNVLLLPGPGILRTLLSRSEFDKDSTKKGWTKDELARLTKLTDSCAAIAKTKNIRFIFENLNEPFFGNDSTYGGGLTDFFAMTKGTGLQFDIGNAFRNSSRVKADPEKVAEYLPSLGDRWVTTHLKTLQKGESQPVLTDNPLPLEKVVALMGKQNVLYATIELLPVADKQQCFDNHAKSIQFLKEKGILKD